MASYFKESPDFEKLFDEVKTALAKAYRQIFESEYAYLFQTTFEKVEDPDLVKDILSEGFLAVLESGLKTFQPDEVKNHLKQQIRDSCQKHFDEIDAKREFQIIHGCPIEYDNSRDEEIMKAALEAFHELPPARKKILYETLSGSTPRTVAENNKMATEMVLKMNWKTRKILKKILFSKI